MNEKIYKTSFCFPVVKCDLRIESNKVKKPTGITYILLELIKSYKAKGTFLKDELLLFGIPKDLHYIFSRELVNLCNQNIIIFRNGNIFNEIDFNSCYVHEFTFSDFGLKVFKEGAIPTDERKKYPITLYYSIVDNTFFDNKISKGKLAKSDTSIYSDYKYPEINSEMIDFEGIFEDNKRQFKAKEEEIFKAGIIMDQEGMVLEVSDELNVSFNYNKVNFEFKNADRKNFFTSELNSQMIESHFLKLKKFDFNKMLYEEYSIPEKNEIPLLGDIFDIYIPSQISELLHRDAKIVFDRNLFKINNSNKTPKIGKRIGKELSDRILNAVDSCIAAAFVEKNHISLICPIKMNFFNDVLNEYIPINVIFEFKASNDLSKRLFDESIKYVFSSKFNGFNAEIITLTAELSDNNDLLKEYLYYIKDQSQKDYRNIVYFNDIVNKILKKDEKWEQTYQIFIKDIFEKNKSNINNDNLTETHDLLKPLKDSLGMSDVEFIGYLTSNIDVKENYNILFYTFEQYKYKPENIMPSINIVEIYLKNILDGDGIEESIVKNKLESDFKKLENYFDNLRELLGINSYFDIVKESFDNVEFQKNYKAFADTLKIIEKYRNFSSKKFAEMDEYIKVFEAVHDVVVMELSAMKDAKGITKKYIENLIMKADLKNAVCDMHIRLQDYILDYYNEKKYSSEMIERLMYDYVIDEETMDILFQLVKCRNGLQHPKNRSVNFGKDDVVRWCNVLFEVIEGGENSNEPSGENRL